MAGIIWLASYQKSGNTWLRAFLANLMRNPDRPIAINDLPNHILGDGFLTHYETFTGKPASALSIEEIRALRPKIHNWFAQSSQDDVFVKTHNACVLLEGEPLITPSATAGAINVVRNPLDVAVSFAHHHQIDMQHAVDRLCDDRNIVPGTDKKVEEYLLSWSSHVRSWLNAPGLHSHLMRYEDMLKAPRKSFGGLVKFLGLPNDPPRLKKAIRFSNFRELADQEKKERFVEARPDGKAAFFREGKTGGWRSVLSQEHVDQLIECHGEVMKELGYLDPKGRLKV